MKILCFRLKGLTVPFVALLLLLPLWCQAPARAELPTGWTTTLLGKQTTGSATYNSGTGAFTVNGKGRPVGQYEGGTFTYKQMTGNFDFKARVSSYTMPTSGTQANLLAMNTPASYNGQSSQYMWSFGPTQSPALDPNGGQAAGKAYYATGAVITWYRLTRYDNTFTSWYSSDGVDWTPDVTGSWYAANSTLCVGFAVGNDDNSSTAASATFDNVSLTPLTLAYKTSWAGNSGGSPGDFVGQTLNAFAVSSQGVVYTECPYEEGSKHNQVFAEVGGRGVRIDSLHGVGGAQIMTVTPATSTTPGYMYTALDGFVRMPLNADGSYQYSSPRYNDWSIPFPTGMGGYDFSGMAVRGDELFVSDKKNNLIRVYSISSKTELRNWSMASPGGITIDGSGNLWIIRLTATSGNPIQNNIHDGDQVQCWTPGSGSSAGTQLTARTISANGVRPSHVFYDAPRSRLLIADDGQAQNIRAYTNLSSTPSLDTSFFNNGTFGVSGGIYAGSNPGFINEPASGGMARFNAPMGISADTAGNLYVAGRSQVWNSGGTDIRKFDSAGNYKWGLFGLIFTQDAAFDPTTDGQDLYSVRNHFGLDYSKTQGNEWSYKGFTIGQFAYDYSSTYGTNVGGGTQYNGSGGAQMFVSGGKRFFVHGTTIYRFNGEVAVPAWRYTIGNNGRSYWSDTNGDGIVAASEKVNLSSTYTIPQSVTVNPNGDLWIVESDGPGNSTIRKVALTGIAANGVPIYDASNATTYPAPTQFRIVSRVQYDQVNDIMYVSGERAGVDFGNGSGVAENRAVCRYNNWNTGNRTPQYTLVLPYDKTVTEADAFLQVSSVKVVGDYIFALTSMEAYGGSGVYAYKVADGTLVQRFVAGPEIGGRSGHIDNECQINVIKRSNGEYVMALEENGNNKIIIYRWTPVGTPTPTPTPTDGSAYSGVISLPAKVEAENFNTGGQNVAYNDSDAANQGGQYRTSEGVDIETTSDTGSGHNVGWMNSGEWMKYAVNVASAGTYNLTVRVASASSGGTMHVEFGGVNKTGSITVPNTGNWQTWQDVTINNISLAAGAQTMRVVMDSGSFNLNYVQVSATTPTPTPTGTITRDVWNNIGGSAVSAIPVTTTPSSTGTLTSFEAPSNVADNYGQRIRGFLTAPTNGSYFFWIAGDDNCELYLTTNGQKNKIAQVLTWTESRIWNTEAGQKSTAISLTAGQQYYVEALMKEEGGGDNLAVGWAKPGQVTTAPSEVIPGSALSPFVATATATSAKLTGTVIGTTGSWSGTTSDDKSKAFDGSFTTFFDAATSQGWVGYDLGSSKTLSQVKYAPRSGQASRMTGGKVQGSTTADFSSGVTDLFTISGSPTEGSLTSQNISGSSRYVRYLSPANGYGNIAELEFWGN